MAGAITEMLKGTLEGCVLEIIGRGETYGYEITRQLNDLGLSEVVEGTVYAILVRLEKRGMVEAQKRPSEIGPPRKWYSLTDEGRRELERFWKNWDRLTTIIETLRKGDHHGRR